jgi:hypothetical protein
MDFMDENYDEQAALEQVRAELLAERAIGEDIKAGKTPKAKPVVEAEPEDEVTTWTGSESFAPTQLPVVKLSARGIPTHTEDGDILSADARWRLMWNRAGDAA